MALAQSERSDSRRARYSGVTSPVTYSPEKHEVSNSLMLRMIVHAGRDQIFEILVDQPVGADELARLPRPCGRAGDELARGRHVDAVDVRETHRRRGRGEIHLARAGFAGQLDDLRRGRAAHDRVVHQQHVLAAEFQVDRVELAAHRLRALLLARHDERAADVAVLDEALAVLHAELLRQLQRAGAAGVGNRDDHVDVVIGRARAGSSPPSRSPMRMRAWYTEMLSIIESGRAKYTYSKMHGA